MNFPSRGVEIAQILYERNPTLVHGNETQRRQLHKMIAQQMVFELPEGNNWGVKSADENRPQSKDAIAFRRSDGLLDIWDIQNGTTRKLVVQPNEPPHYPAENQHFIEVTPFNHIDNGTTPIPQPPSNDECNCKEEIEAIREVLLQVVLEFNTVKLGIKDIKDKLPQEFPQEFPIYRGSIFGFDITLTPDK